MCYVVAVTVLCALAARTGTKMPKTKRETELNTLDASFCWHFALASMIDVHICMYLMYSTVECVLSCIVWYGFLQSGRVCFPLLHFSVLGIKNGERGKRFTSTHSTRRERECVYTVVDDDMRLLRFFISIRNVHRERTLVLGMLE